MDGSSGGDDSVVHGSGGAVERRYDWSERRPSRAVVDLVSDALGRDATDIEPLAKRVDPDALDAVLGPSSEVEDPAVTVSFEFADRHVTVSADGYVVVRPLDVG